MPFLLQRVSFTKLTWSTSHLLPQRKQSTAKPKCIPDSLVGTDSHTTMINGLGVVGWGVGGIEAEAGMLGQPLYFVTPEVIGFKLTGKLPKARRQPTLL